MNIVWHSPNTALKHSIECWMWASVICGSNAVKDDGFASIYVYASCIVHDDSRISFIHSIQLCIVTSSAQVFRLVFFSAFVHTYNPYLCCIIVDFIYVVFFSSWCIHIFYARTTAHILIQKRTKATFFCHSAAHNHSNISRTISGTLSLSLSFLLYLLMVLYT